MAGLDPAIYRGRVPAQMAGSSPPMTREAPVRLHDYGVKPGHGDGCRMDHTGSGAAFSRSMLNRLLTLRSFTWLISRR